MKRPALWCALLLIGLTLPCGASERLRILAWPGYADADWVQQFEKQYNAQVDVTFIDSDEALWDKLNKNHGENYDLFAVNTAELQRYIDEKIAAPIQAAQISNIKNQLPRFQKTSAIAGLTRNGQLYAIPFTYSEMGLIYDKKQVRTPPTSMQELWKPQYKGKIVLFDSSNHNFSFTALATGIQHPFNLSHTEMSQVVKQLLTLREQKPLFYNTPEEGNRAFINNHAALMFGNYGNQQIKLLRDAGADIGYIIPKEGALAWLDCWAMSISAKNKTLAQQWINFTLEKTVSYELTRRQGLFNTLTQSNLKDNDKIIWLQPSENFALRAQYWQRIRTAGDVQVKKQ